MLCWHITHLIPHLTKGDFSAYKLKIAKMKIAPLIEEYKSNVTTQEQKVKLHTYENYLLDINKFENLIYYIYNHIDQLKKNQD
jgi:hypothetical protein